MLFPQGYHVITRIMLHLYQYQCYIVHSETVVVLPGVLTRYRQDGHAKTDSSEVWFNAPVYGGRGDLTIHDSFRWNIS